MKRCLSISGLLSFLLIFHGYGQNPPDYSRIDIMLVNGKYEKAADTCKLLLRTDSLNSELWYKLGMAYQNMIPDDNSFECFRQASFNDPANNLYKFTVAKGYFNKNKFARAKPLLLELCSSDSTNWPYAFYLTGIYMQEGKIDESIEIYNRFLKYDSTNYIFLDKLGFAYLRKGKTETAIDYYNRSLEINKSNINAIKNLSYLLPFVHKTDSALSLLNRAIRMDPDDMDLYARRATINFGKNYYKRALDDYLLILSSGDSSFLYLKRVGIGYTMNLQPKMAIKYLLKATIRDTTDYETLDYLARNYHDLDNPEKCQYYYTKVIRILQPLSTQLGLTHMMLADEYKTDSLYQKAEENYLKSMKLVQSPAINLMIANLYDEKLNDITKAIYYYRQYLATSKQPYLPGYTDSIKKRLTYLEEKQKAAKAEKAKKEK